MGVALPIGTVRMRIRPGGMVAYVKVTHHGPHRKRWARWARVAAAKHFGPLPEGAIVEHRDGNPLNVAPDNLNVVQHIAVLERALQSNPALEAKRRENQSRAASRLAKTRNKLRARIDRSVSIRRGQFYPVSHATQTIIFVPCRTKHQAMRYGQLEAYRHLTLEALRGSKLGTDCLDYRREIPDEGQAWTWGSRSEIHPETP